MAALIRRSDRSVLASDNASDLLRLLRPTDRLRAALRPLARLTPARPSERTLGRISGVRFTCESSSARAAAKSAAVDDRQGRASAKGLRAPESARASIRPLGRWSIIGPQSRRRLIRFDCPLSDARKAERQFASAPLWWSIWWWQLLAMLVRCVRLGRATHWPTATKLSRRKRSNKRAQIQKT